MAVADRLEHIWNEWGLQSIVLLSFALQVKLIIFAELRRRSGSGVLRALGWLAYVMADTTAIYVLGHMATVSRLRGHRLRGHQLMPFWAPFLLLHLGGQDNITAYALEDNKLWLRHLQTLAVQVAGAAYVLYQSTIFTRGRGGGWSFLSTATVLMSVTSVLRYGERVWALKRAVTSPAGDNYRPFERRDDSEDPSPVSCEDAEAVLLTAHKLLDVPRDLIQGPSPVMVVHSGAAEHFHGAQVYRVVEMQLSLMHDVFYTKAEVMRTWYGLCIRVVSPLATAAALWQFHLLVTGRRRAAGTGTGTTTATSTTKEEEDYSGLDVAVTYVLLVGAVVLEAVSVLRMMFSSWTHALLVKWSLAGGARRKTWDLLGRAVAWLRRRVRAADLRGRYCWRGTLGQHNLIRLCARSKASQRSRMARWMGMEDPWNTWVYSESVPVPECVRRLLLRLLLQSKGVQEGNPEHIVNSRGVVALKRSGLDEDLGWSVHAGINLEETILVWHIATDVYLRWFKKEKEKELVKEKEERKLKKDKQVKENNDKKLKETEEKKLMEKEEKEKKRDKELKEEEKEEEKRGEIEEEDKVKKRKNEDEEETDSRMQELVEATETLSNYLLFLLAVRPDMLPPPASRNAYVQTCYDLSAVWCASVDDLATSLQLYGKSSLTPESLFDFSFAPRFAKISKSFLNNETIKRGCQLAIKLISLHSGRPIAVEVDDSNLDSDDEELLHPPQLVLPTPSQQWNPETQNPPQPRDSLASASTTTTASSLVSDGDRQQGKKIEPEILLTTVAEMWTEILCYAGYRCSQLSHASRLSDGGDFVTVVALLLDYLRRGIISSDPLTHGT